MTVTGRILSQTSRDSCLIPVELSWRQEKGFLPDQAPVLASLRFRIPDTYYYWQVPQVDVLLCKSHQRLGAKTLSGLWCMYVMTPQPWEGGWSRAAWAGQGGRQWEAALQVSSQEQDGSQWEGEEGPNVD